MNIEEYLNNYFKGTKEPSLDAMTYFMNEYNNFHNTMKFIHIAGTNGKGSCTEMITNILRKNGYKVGKFISPHLIKYNERISINGNDITDEEMEELIHEVEIKIKKYNKLEKTNCTLFELETTMALLYFYRNNVDFVVLETGLGGLYDCTNVINNTLVSVISSIGYDHMHILGNTLPEIAYQKAGIIKENSHTVLFEQTKEVNDVFANQCNKKNNKLHLLLQEQIKNYKYDDDFQWFDYKELKQIKINLKGIKQIQNAAICIESMMILNKLGYNITEESIREGLSTVIHRARMETLNKNPLIVYDGAHNEPAIKNLQNSVNMYYKNRKRVYIISILKRKDYPQMLKLLMEDENATFILTAGNDADRYATPEELYEVAKKYKKCKQKILIKGLNEALEYAINNNNDTVNLFVGSFYVYSNVINFIKNLT